jgi:hypothetical protein
MQNELEVHDTAASCQPVLLEKSIGFGALHVVPFQI